jgi:hypothetical protein
MKRIVKYVFPFVAIAGLLMPFSAAAQSCDTMLGAVNNFLLSNPGDGLVHSTMVTNRADGAYASYSEMGPGIGFTGQPAWLFYHPAQKGLLYTSPAYVEGTMMSYFSDRRFEPQNNQGITAAWAPFNPNNLDRVTVRIYLTHGYVPGNPPLIAQAINPGQVLVVLNSWGNSVLSFQGSCQNGLLSGYLQSPPTNVWTQFVISVNAVIQVLPQ